MRILIAGGSGLIGKALTESFRIQGHEVYILSRTKRTDPFYIEWSVKEKTIHSDMDFEAVINLTGAGIVDKAWTSTYRNEIINSRINSVATLDSYFSTRHVKPNVYINANAVGVYGHADEYLFSESDQAKEMDFMVDVCQLWEKAVHQMTSQINHVYIARIGVVLAKEDGAFPKLSIGRPTGIIPHLGSGMQYISWIHIEDLVAIFQHLLINQPASGAYNCVAPNPVTNQQVSKAIAKTGLFKISPPVPAFILKLVMGQRSIALLNSTRVSSGKIESAGFEFQFSDIDTAVKSLI